MVLMHWKKRDLLKNVIARCAQWKAQDHVVIALKSVGSKLFEMIIHQMNWNRQLIASLWKGSTDLQHMGHGNKEDESREVIGEGTGKGSPAIDTHKLGSSGFYV